MSFEDQAAWEDWLAGHYDQKGVWIKIAKKATGIPSVDHPDALEVALCYGWIDGQAKSVDEQFYLQKFTPRKPRSLWSKINRVKVEALIAAGRMRPPGMHEIERAKADGRWDAAYDSPSSATVPEDLQQALDANPAAREFFNSLNGTNRFAVLHRIQIAKKPETRAARIQKLVEMLARGEKIYP